MIALTVRQPFASAIVTGRKTVENRSRPTAMRGQVVVHAGKQIHDIYRRARPEAWIERLPRAAVVGLVQLVECHNADVCPTPEECEAGGAFWPNVIDPVVWHWILRDPVELTTPIPRVLGQLGFWTPDDRVQHLIGMATGSGS